MRSKILALVALVGALALLGACTADSTPAATPTGTPEPAQTPGEPTSEPPALMLRLPDGSEVPLRVGTYCYGSLCVDTIGILTTHDETAVPAGATVTLTGGAADEPRNGATASVWPLPAEPAAEGDDWVAWHPDADEIATRVEDDDTFALPSGLAPGRYLLAVAFSFVEGDAMYGLVLDVQ